MNKSPVGVVIGMVQLQLPTVTSHHPHGRVLLATGGAQADEIITAEVRRDLVREARRVWGVENNLYQRYRLPWADEVVHVDGSGCEFAPPQRA